MYRTANWAISALLLVAMGGCGLTESKYIDYTEDAADGAVPPPTNVTYTANIKSLLDASCATSGCHVGGGTAPDLSAYAGASSGGPRSQVRIAAGTMPPSGALSASNKALFKAWVDAGYTQ